MLKHYDQRENKVLKASSQKWRQEELNSRVLRHEQEAALVLRGLVLSSNQEKSPEQQGVMAAAQNHHVPAGSYTMLHSTTDPTQSYRAAQRIQAASLGCLPGSVYLQNWDLHVLGGNQGPAQHFNNRTIKFLCQHPGLAWLHQLDKC